MAEIINLRRARKAKQRQEAADVGAQNRALHGQAKSARNKQAVDAARQKRLLDNAKLDDSD
jgi:Domain of unknown function (DUF4169)